MLFGNLEILRRTQYKSKNNGTTRAKHIKKKTKKNCFMRLMTTVVYAVRGVRGNYRKPQKQKRQKKINNNIVLCAFRQKIRVIQLFGARVITPPPIKKKQKNFINDGRLPQILILLAVNGFAKKSSYTPLCLSRPTIRQYYYLPEIT